MRAAAHPARRTARFAAAAALLAGGSARAASVSIAAGAEQTLDGDVMLSGAETFTAGETGGARCKIHGAGHSIRTAADTSWTGAFTMHSCDVDGLGTATVPAVGLSGSGAAAVVIDGSTFSASGKIDLTVFGDMSVAFVGNTIQADSVVPAVKLAPESDSVFHATGFSTGVKVFQGNRILKSGIGFQSTGGWLIGGDTAAEGNVMVGTRAGIGFTNSSDMIVRNNYSRTFGGFQWNQVKNPSVSTGSNNLIEHNVFRGLNWLAELNGGVELRDNLLIDATERGWVLVWSKVGAKVHHNLLVTTKENTEGSAGGFVLEEGDATDATPPNLEIYNNTLDAGGVCNAGIGGGVVLHGGSVLASLRSNVFSGIRLPPDLGGSLVRTTDPAMGEPPIPLRLDYADYNLFFNPDSPVKVNYGLGVADKIERQDPGYAYHDIPVGGAANMQVDPGFAGKVPRTFPFTDNDVIAGTTTVCQILAYYRQVYAPAAGSPLVGAGDPADGVGNDLGAIAAAGTAFLPAACDPTDVGHPLATADVYTCKTVAIETSGGGGGGGIIDMSRGVTCVCGVADGQPRPWAWGGALVAAASLVGVRKRRRRR